MEKLDKCIKELLEAVRKAPRDFQFVIRHAFVSNLVVRTIKNGNGLFSLPPA